MRRWAVLLLLAVGLAVGLGAAPSMATELPPVTATELPPVTATIAAITVPTLTSADLETLLNSYDEPMGRITASPGGMGTIGVLILAMGFWFLIPRRR